MIIDEDNGSDNEKPAVTDVAGTAYRESMTSVDGFTRGPNGRVKFNKDTKKRRREDEELEDVEMADGEAGSTKAKKNKRKADARIGQEFKAKVGANLVLLLCSSSSYLAKQKAGGDVKKGGVDPYAYMSLSQATKKGGKGGRSQIGIVGKR